MENLIAKVNELRAYNTEKEWFELTTTKFEDSLFFIPKDYDKILRLIYGDYMTPKKY